MPALIFTTSKPDNKGFEKTNRNFITLIFMTFKISQTIIILITCVPVNELKLHRCL